MVQCWEHSCVQRWYSAHIPSDPFFTIFVHHQPLSFWQSGTVACLLDCLQTVRACFFCSWFGELKSTWEFRSPQGILDQWQTGPGIWKPNFLSSGDSEIQLRLYRVPLRIRLKLPSMRLNLKSSPFLAISPFLSWFSHSPPDLPWEDPTHKSQMCTHPHGKSNSRESPETRASYVAATLLGTWHILSCSLAQSCRAGTTVPILQMQKLRSREGWLCQVYSSQEGQIQNSKFRTQTMSLESTLSTLWGLVCYKRSEPSTEGSYHKDTRESLQFYLRGISALERALSYMPRSEHLPSSWESWMTWTNGKGVFYYLFISIQTPPPHYVKWQLPEILSSSLSKCQ